MCLSTEIKNKREKLNNMFQSDKNHMVDSNNSYANK
jgi:hypothetical protein